MFRWTSNFLVAFFLVLTTMSVNFALAQGKYSIKQMTPEVENALENRRARYDDLSSLKSEGLAGENNRGYVAALKDEGRVNQIVDAENQDCRVIYKTIAKQNDLTGALETIEKVFAQVQREKAGIGEMIQMEDGSWSKKN